MDHYIIGMANSFFGLGSLILSTFSQASLEYHEITKEFTNGNNHTELINVLFEREKLDPEGLEAKMQNIHEESLAIHGFELIVVAMLGLVIDLTQQYILGLADHNLPRVLLIVGMIVSYLRGFFIITKLWIASSKVTIEMLATKSPLLKLAGSFIGILFDEKKAVLYDTMLMKYGNTTLFAYRLILMSCIEFVLILGFALCSQHLIISCLILGSLILLCTGIHIGFWTRLNQRELIKQINYLLGKMSTNLTLNENQMEAMYSFTRNPMTGGHLITVGTLCILSSILIVSGILA